MVVVLNFVSLAMQNSTTKLLSEMPWVFIPGL